MSESLLSKSKWQVVSCVTFGLLTFPILLGCHQRLPRGTYGIQFRNESGEDFTGVQLLRDDHTWFAGAGNLPSGTLASFELKREPLPPRVVLQWVDKEGVAQERVLEFDSTLVKEVNSSYQYPRVTFHFNNEGEVSISKELKRN